MKVNNPNMNETVKEIVHNIGGHMLWENGGSDNGLITPGEVIHEVGTTRMGNNPKTSVVNKYEQLHDAKKCFYCRWWTICFSS